MDDPRLADALRQLTEEVEGLKHKLEEVALVTVLIVVIGAIAILFALFGSR